MPKRQGALLVAAQGKEQEFRNSIQVMIDNGLIDPNYLWKGTDVNSIVQTYDDRYGGPTWYIP